MGNISPEATYRFTILPPWYRTIWAYIGYVLFFVAFVWGAITVSTRSLKKIIREATAEIQAQKDELEEKNQNIMDSIRYAKRIQEAVTPTESQMKKFFPEHFVLWRPRDIVSGDFFWMMHKNDKVIIAAADCTGHGVPGAFMSIMGISFLNQIANMPEVQNAADALNHLRHNVITSLNQEGSETDTKDGMDISLCVYDFKEMIMEFSGAYNPLYMIRNEELSVIKADRMPVGIHERMDRPFTNNKFTIMKGDIFYILSDGYIDQFGGPKGKKFMTKRFKELILRIHKLPMDEQSRILEEELLKWRGDIEQIDDIIIIGIRVV
jgi:serine phosphatase RsbU (regulator of sigma subunit)